MGKRRRPDLRLGLQPFQHVFLPYNAFHTHFNTMPSKKCSKKSSKQTPAHNNGPHAPTAARPAHSAVLDALDQGLYTSPPLLTLAGLCWTQPIQNANFLALEWLELSSDFPVHACWTSESNGLSDGLSVGISPNQQSNSNQK